MNFKNNQLQIYYSTIYFSLKKGISYYSQKCQKVELDEQLDLALNELNKKDSEANAIYQRALQKARKENQRTHIKSNKIDPEDDLNCYVAVEPTSQRRKSIHQQQSDKNNSNKIDISKLPAEIRESIARNLVI
jgi:hypothetical protein